MSLPNQKERSTQFPALHPVNLLQLRSAVGHFVGRTDKYGSIVQGVYFHGDGNMYPTKKESDERKDYLNDHPVNEGAKYRAFFTKTDGIPTSLAEMEKTLVSSKIKEDQDAALEATKKTSNDLSFPMIAAPAEVKAEPVAKSEPVATPVPPLPPEADDKGKKAK